MTKFIVSTALTALISAGAALSATADDIQDRSLFQAYFVCSEKAEMAVMDHSEASKCADLYMQVKLSFVDGVDLDGFKAMTAYDRATINEQGYLAYTDWRAENPEMVNDLKEEARALIAETGS